MTTEILTANQSEVLASLRREVEGRWTDAVDSNKVWGQVYLPNCNGFGSRGFAGTLGTLEKLGLYRSDDEVFGNVVVENV